MKRIFFLFCIVSLISAPAWAAYGTGTVTLGGTNTKTFKTSKNVNIDYSGGTSGLSYSVVAYHSKGAKTFGSYAGAQKIFWTDGTAASLPTAPTTADGTADFSSWDEM